jgi:hypothetical protein
VNTDAAPPPTPSLRRLHRQPAVSIVTTPFSLRRSLILFLPVRVPSCRRTPVASPFFQERATTRAAHDAPPRRGHPRHAASVGLERVPLCSICCWPDRGPPRGAPPSRVPSGCRASSPVESSVPCCQAHACVSPSRPHPSAPWPRPRRGVAQRVGPWRRAARCGWCSGRWPSRVSLVLLDCACRCHEPSAHQLLGSARRAAERAQERGVAVYRRRVLLAAPSCEPAFEPMRP